MTKWEVGQTGNTRDGRPYRIICVDAKGSNPIVALITHYNIDTPREVISLVRADGTYQGLGQELSHLDLMPPSEKVYVNIFMIPPSRQLVLSPTYPTSRAAEGAAQNMVDKHGYVPVLTGHCLEIICPAKFFANPKKTTTEVF